MNNIVRNIKRLLIEDREWCTRRFPEGRPERWFFDDYQFIEGGDYNWYCGLAPPRSHWHTVSDGHDVYDTPHHKYTLEMEEKAMRLAGWLVWHWPHAQDTIPHDLMAFDTELILVNKPDIEDKERRYRYMMMDKEIKRGWGLLAKAKAKGIVLTPPQLEHGPPSRKAKPKANAKTKAKCKATSKAKSPNLKKAKSNAKGKDGKGDRR